MSIEIIPAGASAVVTERGCNNGNCGNNGCCGNNNNCGNNCCCQTPSYSDGEVQVMRDVKDARQDIIDKEMQVMRDVKDSRYDVVAAQTERFIKLNDTVTQSASAASLANSHTVEIMQNGFCQGAVATTAGFAANALSVSNAQRELGDKLDDGLDAVNDSVQSASKENLVSQYQIASAAVRDACENQNKTMLSFKDVQLSQERLSKEGELHLGALSALHERLAAQASKEAALCCCESKLQAERLAALHERLACQASKEAALCCCETKATILAEGAATRNLINDIERDRLRDGKARAETALAAYFAAKVPPVVPVI